MAKKNVAIIFGGQSAEHEISLRSAQNVIEAIDKDKYNLLLIAIDKKGKWFTKYKCEVEDLQFPLKLDFFRDPVALSLDGSASLFLPSKGNYALDIDVFFPILHGPYGEDGTIQGLFRMMNVAFVGCGVLGSAVGMDKDVMKRLFRDAGIPIGDYIAAFNNSLPTFESVEEKLGLPVYVKPANLGSSVGISKVANQEDYLKAVELAFQYDQKIVIEANIDGREIECAVLGNRKPKASKVGWVKSTHNFYTYESKYLDDQGYKLEIPAAIPEEKQKEIQEMCIRVYRALDTEGLGRVDVFLKDNGEIVVNEINTMPGFTSISMYPMLWKESGLAYGALIDELIRLAFERQESLLALKKTI